MKSSNVSIIPNDTPEQKQQFMLFALRLVDALKEFWWIVLVLWGVFSYTSNIQYSVTELQAKYAGLDTTVTEIKTSQASIQESLNNIEVQIGSTLTPLQKDAENTKEGLQEVRSNIRDIQKDIKTLLSR